MEKNNNIVIVNYVGNAEGKNIPDYNQYTDIINELYNAANENNRIDMMVYGKLIINAKIYGVSVLPSGNPSIKFIKNNGESINLDLNKYYTRKKKFNEIHLNDAISCWMPLNIFANVAMHETSKSSVEPIKEEKKHSCNGECNCKKNSNKVSMDYIKDKYKKKLANEAEKKFKNKKLDELPVNCRIEMIAESGKIPKPLRDEILNPESNTHGIYLISSENKTDYFIFNEVINENDGSNIEITLTNILNDSIIRIPLSLIENGSVTISLYGACQIGKEDIDALSKNLSNIFKDILGEDVDLRNIFTEWR